MSEKGRKKYLKRTHKKDEERTCSDKTRSNGFKLKKSILKLSIRRKYFMMRVVTQKQIAQRNCECPTTGTIQGQIRHGFGHPDVRKDLPSHGRRIGLDYFEWFLSIQTTP